WRSRGRPGPRPPRASRRPGPWSSTCSALARSNWPNGSRPAGSTGSHRRAAGTGSRPVSPYCPVWTRGCAGGSPNSSPSAGRHWSDRKSTRLNSSHVKISYAVFCLKILASLLCSPLFPYTTLFRSHLLGAGQVELAKRFATGGIDRFAPPCRWHRLPTGEPVLSGVDTWLRGRITEQLTVGGSTLV